VSDYCEDLQNLAKTTETRNTTTRALAIATAIALVADKSEANTSPGEYNITTDEFDILSLDYRTGELMKREGTTLNRKNKTFNNVGYKGNETITVEGDDKGLEELEKAMKWLQSSENKIPWKKEYKEATLIPIYNEDGSMYSIKEQAGRGTTYQCEQYSVDTANELKKNGIPNVFIAILSSKENTEYAGHAIIAIQTGEKKDEHGQRYPIFALIEPEPESLYNETKKPDIIGVVGSGKPITTIGKNNEMKVSTIQLIRPENFIDYKGTKGILIPGENAIFQYTEKPTTSLERTSGIERLNEIKEKLTQKNMSIEVKEGKLTKGDMEAITMKLGEL